MMFSKHEHVTLETGYLVIYDTPLEQKQREFGSDREADDFARSVLADGRASAASVYELRRTRLTKYWT